MPYACTHCAHSFEDEELADDHCPFCVSPRGFLKRFATREEANREAEALVRESKSIPHHYVD